MYRRQALTFRISNDNTEAIRLRMSPDMPQFADMVEKFRCNQGKRVMNIRDLILLAAAFIAATLSLAAP